MGQENDGTFYILFVIRGSSVEHILSLPLSSSEIYNRRADMPLQLGHNMALQEQVFPCYCRCASQDI